MANNALIGAVRSEATLEGGKFVSGARKIRQEAKATETQLKKSFGAMGASVKGFGSALTAGLSIGLLSAGIKKALDYAGSLAEVAQQLGVTAKDLQTFRYAAGQVGVSQDQLETGLSKLTITLGKVAAGAKEPAKALAAIGISADQLKGKDTGEAFRLIADGLSKITDRAQRAAVEVALFGKTGSKLDNLLAGGSSALNELTKAAEKLGIVLSDEQIRNADETADKLEAVKTVLAAQIAGIVADNAQSILSLAQSLGALTGEIIKFLNSNPGAALAIVGGLAGARLGGLPGAAAGALAGYGIGRGLETENPRTAAEDQRYYRHNFIKRVDEARALRAAGKTQEASAAFASARRLRNKFVAAGGIVPGFNDGKAAPSGSISQFLAPSGGRTPKAPRDRSDDVTFQFDQELKRAHADTLRAQQSIATTADKRAEIALQLLDIDKQMQTAELQDRVRRAERDFAEGKITKGALDEVKAQAVKLQAEYDDADALQKKAIADDLAAGKAHDAAELADSAYDLRLEQLQAEAGLKETASERREVELRILDLMKQQEKARLEAVIADTRASELAKDQARQRLDSLDSIYAGRAAGVIQGTRGPMEDWLAKLPTTAAKAQEAFEQLETQGFDGLIDAAVALTDGFDSAKDALLSTLKQFLQGILRMQLQQGFGSLLGSGSGIGGLFKSIFGAGVGVSNPGNLSDPGFGFESQGSLVGLPQFARGGSLRVRGIPGIDRNTLSLNGMPVARISDMERLRIDPANDRGRSDGRGGVTVNVNGVSDFDSFRRNERQTGRTTRRLLGIN